MAAPNVQIQEIDLSTRVPAFPGTYGGIVIPAKKGPIDQVRLISSDTELLSVFTPDESIEVGYDLAYFSALAYLEKANRLWVKRVAKDALYGGIEVSKAGSTSPNHSKPVSAGMVDPTAYTFSSAGCILLYGANEGAWNNSIAITIQTYADSPLVVKEEDAFIITVYKTSNLNVPVEQHVCSRIEGKKDGFGRNIFINDVLETSNYIRGFNNEAIDEAIYPEEITTPLTMEQGDDGTAVTDSEMIIGAEVFQNPDDIFVTLLMDGGWATPAYQSKLNLIASNRKDSVALLSVPYVKEASSNYLNDILDYRRTELNLNSSYSSLFSPHCRIYDKFNDRALYVAPDGYAAAAISQSAANYEIWFPPAGPRRGIVNALDLKRRFTTAEMDSLYDAGVNPLRFAPGKGIMIWGQKTLLSRPSSLDRLNVRLLLIVIQPAIKEALEDFLFELNDEPTRALATAVVDSYMENILARRGVTDYQVICDNTNNSAEDIDNYRMNVWLFVKPSKAVEYIPFKTIITKEGISFELAASQLGA